MVDSGKTQPDRPVGEVRPSRSRAGRLCGHALGVVFVLLTVAMVSMGALLTRLSQGPLSIAGLTERIASELGARLGPDYRIAIGSSSIERVETSLRLSLAGLSVRDSAGKAIFNAPRASVSVAIAPLLTGSIRPTRLDIYGVEMGLTVLENGDLAVSAGAEPIVLGGGASPAVGDGEAPVSVAPVEPRAAARAALRSMSKAISNVFGLLSRSDSPIQRMENVGISAGRLSFEDRLNGRSTVFSNVELGFERRGESADIAFAADGANGRLQARASAAPDRPAPAIEVEIRDLGFDEIALLGGIRSPQAFFDMPLSAKGLIGLDRAGAIADMNLRFNAGAGFIYVRDSDFEPMFVDEVTGGLSWSASSRSVVLEPTQWASGDTQLTVSGKLSPPSDAGGPWTFAGQAAPGSVLGIERQGDVPVQMDNAGLAVSIFPAEHRLTLDRLTLATPAVNVTLSGDFDWGEETRRARLNINAGPTAARAALRIWPAFVAPPVHTWLLDHLVAGTVQQGTMNLDFDGPAIDNALKKGPPDDDRMHLDVSISGAALRFLNGAPPLSGVDAAAHVTGHTASFAIKRGMIDGAPGHRVTMSEGSFTVADTTLKPAPALVNAHLAGSLDAFVDVLSHEGFRPFVGAMGDTSSVKGQMDGHLAVDLALDTKPRPEETQVRANAVVSDFTVDRLIGKERFEQGQLTLVIDKAGMHASGAGRMFGSPSQIEFKKQGPAAIDANIAFAIDDAARARVAPAFATGMSGPILAHVSSSIAGKDAQPPPAHVELDFTKTSFDNPLPGIVKAAGRPAKATFRAQPGADGVHLDQIVFDSSSGASMRGAIDFDATGTMRVAHFSQMRLSPGDDLKVDAEFGRDGLKLTASGASVDARPFLSGLFGGSGNGNEKAAGGVGKDLELDLKTTLATGYNRQALANLDLKMVRRGGYVRSVRLQGLLGKSPVSITTVLDKTGASVLNVTSGDGGALIAFVDLYRRMEGGRLRADLQMNARGVTGTAFFSDFILRDEPALRRLVSQGAPTAENDVVRKIDTSAAPFIRLSGAFSRQNGVLHVTDGLLYGAQIGIKVDGLLDYTQDRVDMAGTFVPAYVLNNLFTQIPIFGPILSGGSHEGLFAVNFRISGPATSPSLIVNPLSAIAPGFLRKIFGAGAPADPGPQPATDAPATIPKP